MSIYSSLNIRNLTKHMLGILLLLALMRSVFAEEAKTSLSGFPVIAYSNETSVMAGGFLVWNKEFNIKESKATNTIISNALVTAKSQYLAFLLPQFTRKDGDLQYGADLIARRWSDNFWGIGNGTLERSKEAFGWEEYRLGFNAKYRIWDNLYPGVELDFRFGDLFKESAGGAMASGNISGSKPAFYVGRGASLSWDNTNAKYYPEKGINYELRFMDYATLHNQDGDLGELKEYIDSDFNKLTLNLNHYINPVQGLVLAAQTSVVLSDKQVPFNFLPELGSKLRAYDSKRYIDKAMLAQRIEPRIFPSELPFFKDRGIMQSKFWRRTGMVLYSEFGQVAPEISQTSWERNHFSNGFGFRYTILPQDKLNLRMDFGWGQDTFNFIFQAREVF